MIFLYKNFLLYIVLLCALSLPKLSAGSAPTFSMHSFVEAMLTHSLEHKKIQASETAELMPLLEAKALLDWQFSTDFSKSYEEPFDLNISDQDTNQFSTKLQKTFLTGTNLKLEYLYMGIDKNSSETAMKLPDIAAPNINLAIEQDLIQNIFGVEDRAKQAVARHQVDLAQTRLMEEKEDLIIQAINQFWQTYISQLSLKLKQETQKDYKSLVKITRSKKNYNYTRPGELNQMLAELETANRESILQKTDYENQLQQFLNLLNQNQYQTVRLKAPSSLPASPPPLSQELKQTPRTVQLMQKKFFIQQEQSKIFKSQTWPKVKLFASYGLGGQANNRDDAFKNLFEQNNQQFSYGIKLHYLIPSSGIYRKRTAIRKQALESSRLEMEITKKDFNRLMQFTQNNLKTLYQSVKSSEKIYKLRKLSYKQIRAAYLQGRLDVFQLIQAKKNSQASEIEHITLLSQYHEALAYAYALRDELLNKYKATTN